MIAHYLFLGVKLIQGRCFIIIRTDLNVVPNPNCCEHKWKYHNVKLLPTNFWTIFFVCHLLFKNNAKWKHIIQIIFYVEKKSCAQNASILIYIWTYNHPKPKYDNFKVSWKYELWHSWRSETNGINCTCKIKTDKTLFSVIIAPRRTSCTHWHTIHLHLWWNQRKNHTSMSIAMSYQFPSSCKSLMCNCNCSQFRRFRGKKKMKKNQLLFTCLSERIFSTFNTPPMRLRLFREWHFLDIFLLHDSSYYIRLEGFYRNM